MQFLFQAFNDFLASDQFRQSVTGHFRVAHYISIATGSSAVEEMMTYSCEVILCVLGCLIICGMIAFRVFKACKREFGKLTRLQSERPKNILWKLKKEPVENDDDTWYDTVSLITNTGFLPYILM